MKIILVAVNAKYIHSNLAIYDLKEYAREYANYIEIAEYTINQYEDDIVRNIYKKKPDVLAFSCYIWNRTHVEHIVENLHKVLPDVPIWLGGPEAYYNAREIMTGANPGIKGIMIGEGEQIFKNLVTHYVEGSLSLEQIPGIIYEKEGEIKQNEPQEIMDLSLVPFPYSDLGAFENKIIYYESSRGCPFSCSYCLSSVEKKLRFRDIELVKKELQMFIDYKIPQVKFVDRTFNCKKSHAMEIWKYIHEHDNGVTNFHFEIAADLIDEEELELIEKMRPGLVQFEIGVQSTNLDTVAEIDRVMDLKKVRNVVNRVNAFHNVHQHLDLIAGLPQEDYESFGNSFNDVYAMKPEQLQLGFLKVLNGSNMYRKQKEYGLVYSSRPPYEILQTNWLTYEEVLRLHSVEAVVELYYNSHQYDASVGYLVSISETPFSLFETLGAFYETTNENGEKHNRIRRYEILLEFARATFGKNENYNQKLFENLLVYDVYLRENIKTRPSFAGEWEQSIWKDFYRSCKKSGRFVHVERFEYPVHLYPEVPMEAGQYDVVFDYEHRDVLTTSAKVSEYQVSE